MSAADEVGHDRLIGEWTASRDAWGVDAVCSSNWKRGLHESQMVQVYSIIRKENGSQLFTGRGVFQIQAGAVRGAWEGSNGAIHPIIGSIEGSFLSVIWGTPETEIGRSEYKIIEDQLVVKDNVLTPSGWREFMTVTYSPIGE